MNLLLCKPDDLQNIRVVLFDVYGTLLKSTRRRDAATAFISWWNRWSQGPAPCCSQFEEKLRQKISVAHEESRGAGVDFPEVQWTRIVQSALDEYGWENTVSAAELETVSTSLVESLNDFSLMDGTVELLRFFLAAGKPLGIVSNAQPYTRIHLGTALASAGMQAWPFEETWTFWSWQFGFSKPSPSVFQIFSARAEARGWQRSQILYFGDRLDKDIEPAQKAGWHTIHVTDLN